MKTSKEKYNTISKLVQENWMFVGTKCSPQDIKYAESIFKVSLPNELKQIILKYNGSSPKKDKTKKGNYIDHFISFSKRDKWNAIIIYQFMTKENRMTPLMIPFAEDSGGNMFCLMYRDNNDKVPIVMLWDHEEADIKAAVTPEAKTFKEFMQGLR